MSFKLYYGEPINKKHESTQIKEIIKQLLKHYQVSEEYCYCLLNFNYGSHESGNKGQYDMVLIFKKSIVILELKNKKGSLNGVIDKNHGNSPIEIAYEGGRKESIKMAQIEREHGSFRSFLINQFKKYRNKPWDEHYNIDVLLVVDEIHENNIEITNLQITKWFDICSTEQVIEKLEERTKDQPFTILPNDIDSIVGWYRLIEVDPHSLIPSSRSYSNVFNQIISVLDIESSEAFKTQHIYDSLSESLSEEEIDTLSTPFIDPDKHTIMDVDRMEMKKGLKALIETDFHPKVIEDLICERFLSVLLEKVQEIVDVFNENKDFDEVFSFDDKMSFFLEFSRIQRFQKELKDLKNIKDSQDKKIKKGILMKSIMNEYWKKGYYPSPVEKEES